MRLKEAMQAIQVAGTTSNKVKGVEKRFPQIVRRPDQPGYMADVRKKKKRKKKKEDDEEDNKNEGRHTTRDDRPMHSGQWDKGFWAKGKEKHIEPDSEEEDDEDDDELKELLMQLSGGIDQIQMDAFWVDGHKYAPDGSEIDPDDEEEDPEKDDTDESFYAGSSQTIGVTSHTDPHFTSKAQDPFWRKGNQYNEPDDEDEDEDEDEEEED